MKTTIRLFPLIRMWLLGALIYFLMASAGLTLWSILPVAFLLGLTYPESILTVEKLNDNEE